MTFNIVKYILCWAFFRVEQEKRKMQVHFLKHCIKYKVKILIMFTTTTLLLRSKYLLFIPLMTSVIHASLCMYYYLPCKLNYWISLDQLEMHCHNAVFLNTYNFYFFVSHWRMMHCYNLNCVKYI